MISWLRKGNLIHNKRNRNCVQSRASLDSIRLKGDIPIYSNIYRVLVKSITMSRILNIDFDASSAKLLEV